MGYGDDRKCVFPLTSLQIGDLQSYLSDLSIFLANESKKFYILVDNRPWLNPGPRSAHLWQLMVTKSRLSPFANMKQRGEKKKKVKKEVSSSSKNIKLEKLQKWFSLIDATPFSKKKLPVKKLQNALFLNNGLHKTLYGFILFEVEWANVRGINYSNELQTDTSLAIEARVMRRWEFESINQALTSMSQWLSRTESERSCLREYLDTAIGEVFYDAEPGFSRATHVEVDVYMDETPKRANNTSDHWENHVSDGENMGEATRYKDVLVLVRFDDCDLPFNLRKIVMSDIRLLTLLETGLPSWVLFLQSYPGFCHIYRPWMCPLARALYVLISVITVLIGFYDLYKNVPLLKATASRLCGPLFDWIETWDMVSRIKYLGTMLFLHNFQKAVKWTLTMARAMHSFFSLLIMPLVNPFIDSLELLLPLWNVLAETVESFVSIVWIIIGSTCSLVGDMVEFVLSPVWFLLSLLWNVATRVLFPIFSVIWEMLYAPIRVVLAAANFSSFVFSYIYDVLGDLWQSMSGLFQLASDSQAVVKTYKVSMWRSLWNDLFSQIFRAVRSILNGFVAFFAACNRHRLSIYNHIQDFINRVLGQAPRSECVDSSHGRTVQSHQRVAETRQKVHAA